MFRFVNVYNAVFGASPEDIERVKFEFIEKFGQELWDRYIHRYLREDKPGLLFSAERTPYKYWVIDYLAQDAAMRVKEEYEIPAEFIALDIPQSETIACSHCGFPAETVFTEDGGRYGYGVVCDPCSYDLLADYLAKFKEEVTGKIATLKAEIAPARTGL